MFRCIVSHSGTRRVAPARELARTFSNFPVVFCDCDFSLPFSPQPVNFFWFFTPSPRANKLQPFLCELTIFFVAGRFPFSFGTPPPTSRAKSSVCLAHLFFSAPLAFDQSFIFEVVPFTESASALSRGMNPPYCLLTSYTPHLNTAFRDLSFFPPPRAPPPLGKLLFCMLQRLSTSRPGYS